MQNSVSTAISNIPQPNIPQPNIQPDESWLQYWPIAAIIVGALILLAAIYFLFLVLQAKRKKSALESAERRVIGETSQQERNRRASDKLIASRMRQSFKQAAATLKAGVTGRNYRYQVPWFLMVGESDSGKSNLLDNAGLPMPLGAIEEQSKAKNICDWYFYSDGLMLNVNGNAFIQSDGSLAGGRLWKQILRQLSKHRPERPIDGIVITIPVSDILSSLDENREKIRAKADAIYRRLIEAQKLLGLCFPVYIIITKCDQITGFREFSMALPDKFKDQIFGWSNPYTLETAFSARWVDEAIAGMDSHIYEMQSEIFATHDYIEGRDDLFLFPYEFQKITDSLKEFMGDIFKQSVYHEAIFLRGIYFSGAVAEMPVSIPSSIAQSDIENDEELFDAIEESMEQSTVNIQARPFFIRELLEKKIFPEWQIARPSSRVTLHQNRTIRSIQIGLAIMIVGWSLWLWAGYNNLLEKREVLLPFLEVLKATDADEIRFSKHIANGTLMIDTARTRETIRNNQQTLEGQEKRLYRGIDFNPVVIDKFVQYANNTDATKLWSIGIPASWPIFTRLHSDITECMRLKYRKFILDVFREKLKLIARRITSKEGALNVVPDEGSALRPEQMPEYSKLIAYSADLDRLGKMINSYNDLTSGGKGDLDKVTSLIEYLFNISPSEGFKNSVSDYFTAAVNKSNGDVIQVDDYRLPATEHFNQLMDALRDRMIHKNPVNKSLEDVQKYMTSLVRFDPVLSNSDHGADEYGGLVDKLNEAIEGLQRNLDRPEFAWVFDSVPRPLRSIFNNMKNTSLATPEKIDIAERNFQDELLTFQNSIITRRADYFEAPLLAKKDGRYRVSDEVISIKKSLATLLSKDFMRTKLPGNIRFADQDIQWNTDGLADCMRLLNENFEFIGKTIPSLDNIKNDLRQSLAKIAKFQIEIDARKRIFESQSGFASKGSDEATVAAQIQHINEVKTVLSTLLQSLRSHELSTAASQLANSVKNQINDLLKKQWKYLDNSGRYEVSHSDIEKWDGELNLSKALFNADKLDDLIENMKIWRTDITASAVKEVQPILSFLQSSAITSSISLGNIPLIPEGRKFQAVAEQLDKYEKKIPGNSVSKLEDFMLQNLDSIKYYTDYKKQTKNLSSISTSSNYFSERLEKMKKDIRDKCDIIADDKAYEFCSDIRNFFGNPDDKLSRYSRLANHFPFVKNPAKYDELADEALPEDIREFYSKFGQRLDFVYKWLANGDASKNYLHDGVNDFKKLVSRMMYLQQTFRSYLQSDKSDATPSFDILFDYRIKFADARGADDIVEWKIQSGDNYITNHNPSQRLRWDWGKPITVSLRWANNGNTVPIKPDSLNGIFRVENRTAVFEFGKKWSLIQMMKAQEPMNESSADNSDAYNWFLKFDVKTKNIVRKEDAAAKVYLRLRLFAPGAKEPIPLDGFIVLPYTANKLVRKTE